MVSENKSIKLYVILFFIFVLLIVGYFCIASFITTLGFTQSFNAKIKEKAVLTSETLSKRHTIVIDPGHGGEDPGAVANGKIEKALNLEIALKLKDFKAFENDAILTRTGDVWLYRPDRRERSSTT